MKYVLVLIATLLGITAMNATDYRLVKATNGRTISLQDMAKELKQYDVVFFGEFHDNATIHQLQYELLPLLRDKRELLLSFEMFERDVQSDLDAYLEGSIDEETFLSNSRPWGNYNTDYRPLIEYAKQTKLQVIAANVPRRYAGKLMRQGIEFMEELDDTERAWIATKLYAPDDDYKKAFYLTMQGFEDHGMSAGMDNLGLLYQAQCLKDDTMAESIVKALSAQPKARVIHYNGDFHSRGFLGTVSRVQTALPKIKIAVITPIYHQNWQQAKPDRDDQNTGTYLIYLPEPENKK